MQQHIWACQSTFSWFLVSTHEIIWERLEYRLPLRKEGVDSFCSILKKKWNGKQIKQWGPAPGTRWAWSCPADIPLLPTSSTGRGCEGQGKNSSLSHAQPTFSAGMLHDRGKAQTHSTQKSGQKVCCPCPITPRELFHIITIQPFLLPPFCFFLVSAV